MGSGAQCWTGVAEGTGADLNIDKVGFKPRRVEIINFDDPGFAFWVEQMTDDSMYKHVDGTGTAVTTNGITPRDKGFVLGADTDMNVSGETIFITCWR